MASIEKLDALLKDASRQLDDAAREIVELQLDSPRDHVRRIATLITSIFQLQRVVWEQAPELRPAYLNDPPRDPGESGRLADALIAASVAVEGGHVEGAIQALEAYLGTKPPEHLAMHALAELERLRR